MGRIIRAILMMSIMIVGSKAQLRGCWNRIGSCITRVEVEDVDKCCPEIKAELFKDRECFCSIRELADRNSSTDIIGGLSTLVKTCDIGSSFDSVCPVGGQPPTTIQSPPSESEDDPIHKPPETTSASPPYPRSPPRPDSEPSPNDGILRQIAVPLIVAGTVIVVLLGLIILVYILRKNKLWCFSTPPITGGGNVGPNVNLPMAAETTGIL